MTRMRTESSLVMSCAAMFVALAGCRESKQEATKPSASISQPVGEAPCPQTFSGLLPADREQTCICSSAKQNGKVWGSGVYTAESSPCSAAMHAGAITAEGGRVTVRSAPGCQSYLGTTNNEVSTSPAPAANKSYFFPSVGDGKCGAETTLD